MEKEKEKEIEMHGFQHMSKYINYFKIIVRIDEFHIFKAQAP
jgi:hypothetical protein